MKKMNTWLRVEKVILLMVFVASVIVFGVSVHDLLKNYRCDSYSIVTGRTTQYIFLDGCYEKDDGSWVRC